MGTGVLRLVPPRRSQRCVDHLLTPWRCQFTYLARDPPPPDYGWSLAHSICYYVSRAPYPAPRGRRALRREERIALRHRLGSRLSRIAIGLRQCGERRCPTAVPLFGASASPARRARARGTRTRYPQEGFARLRRRGLDFAHLTRLKHFVMLTSFRAFAPKTAEISPTTHPCYCRWDAVRGRPPGVASL